MPVQKYMRSHSKTTPTRDSYPNASTFTLIPRTTSRNTVLFFRLATTLGLVYAFVYGTLKALKGPREIGNIVVHVIA